MKKVLFTLVLFVGSVSSAHSACTSLEAQIIAKVASVEPIANSRLCRVKMAWTGRWMFNPAYACPLDIDEVSSFGVIAHCDAKVGEQIDGIAFRSPNATPMEIYLY
ncbi:hypothetical protein [Bdellovibrio bacteriovorus]|uniref:Uncharacterized protein n=1 Tax=Bdellovibrio bacteriovorus str. Tiberius TaxID=1069642 RepID=K7YVW5_BDEBC|nr:hypothetical protein [Bdellovibrio bacteriovorus]AFY00835.1 hypothetical protein Bdt_1135 [Bdellovibrio bacteriovorus str. Tiberius]